MTIKDYNKLYNKIKKIEYDTMVKEFNQFAKLYKTKEKAVGSYNLKKIEIKEKLKCSIISKRFSIDDFKHSFRSKILIIFDDIKAPIEYLIDIYYPIIIDEFKEIKKNEISRKDSPTFDYSFFDNFSKKSAIKFIAKNIAFKDFEDFLFSGESLLDTKNEEINFSIKSTNIQIEPSSIQVEKKENNSIPERSEEKKRKEKRVKKISLKYKNKKEIIDVLYIQLKDEYSYIKVKKEDFECHYKDSEDDSYDRIVWYGDDVEILYLFYKLKTVDAKPYNIIFNHFLNQFGEEFNIESLRQSLDKIKKNKNKEKNVYKNEIKYGERDVYYKNIEEIIKKVNAYI